MKSRILFFLCISINTIYSYDAVLYNGTGAAASDKIAALTLAGIVNRDSARLYLLNVYETWSYTRTDEQWRDIYRTNGNVVFDSVASLSALVNKFRGYLNGAITYDPNRTFGNFSGQSFRWQAEYAALIGGLTNRLPLTASAASSLGLTVSDSVLVTDSFDGDPPIWVTGKLELTSHPWNNSSLTEEQKYLTLLSWGVVNLLSRCNPSKFYIREITDWAVAKKMFQVNLAGTDDLELNSMPTARADILENVLNFMHSKNPNSIFHIYGWIRPEPMTQWFAQFGSSFHETLLGNLSWHSSFPVSNVSLAPPSLVNSDTVQVRDRYYLIFMGTEGDASNWNFGFQSGAWLSAQRGTVPVNWGWNLHLLNECPFVAQYYFQTATPNDGFMSVTSPLGYAYPDLWGNDVWSSAVTDSRNLMSHFSVDKIYGYKHYAGSGTMVYRGKTINNSFNFVKYGQFQSAIQSPLTLIFDPLLPTQTPSTNYGALIFNHVNDGTFYGNVSNLSTAATNIINLIKNKLRPKFLLAGYQRLRQDDFTNRTDPSSVDLSVPRLRQLVDLIKSDSVVGSFVDVVTVEYFSALMRKYLGLTNLTDQEILPQGFTLSQNYPNPFNPATKIQYQLPISSHINLNVYDVLGNKVATLVDEYKPEGSYEVEFNTSRIGNAASRFSTKGGYVSGVYFYRLQAGDFVATKKMILLR
jgi:hypothetical protein